MVPDHAEAEVDIRVPIGISTKTVEEEICRIIQESGAQDVEYSFSWRSEPNSTPRTADIVECLAENVQEIWKEPLTRTYQWASSDARFSGMRVSRRCSMDLQLLPGSIPIMKRRK